jgi:hypothetical protein
MQKRTVDERELADFESVRAFYALGAVSWDELLDLPLEKQLPGLFPCAYTVTISEIGRKSADKHEVFKIPLYVDVEGGGAYLSILTCWSKIRHSHVFKCLLSGTYANFKDFLATLAIHKVEPSDDSENLRQGTNRGWIPILTIHVHSEDGRTAAKAGDLQILLNWIAAGHVAEETLPNVHSETLIRLISVANEYAL